MTVDLLKQFVGRWRGNGRVENATTESYNFSEDLTILTTLDSSLLQYESRAITPEGRSLELGFIRLKDDGSLEVTSIQSGGRVEVLVGSIEGLENGAVIWLRHALIGNDEAVTGITGQLQVSGDKLDYRQQVFLVSLPEMPSRTTTRYNRMPLLMT